MRQTKEIKQVKEMNSNEVKSVIEERDEKSVVPVVYVKKDAAEYLEISEADLDYFTREELLKSFGYSSDGQVNYLMDELETFGKRHMLTIKNYLDYKKEAENKKNKN